MIPFICLLILNVNTDILSPLILKVDSINEDKTKEL